jgi:DNA polymerase V
LPYICIDLKSFYASVECVQRGLDPLDTNLVVADENKTEKTICLAVTPSLKSYGIPGRARLFEVVQKVKEENKYRKYRNKNQEFSGKSSTYSELQKNPSLELDFIIAMPQMAKYKKISTEIYDIYLKYVSADDIHVYSIDEVFIDVSPYLTTYDCTARELAMQMINDVLANTGITATAGVGTNMYLAKIAMDIVAKKMPPDKNGVRIAELDEMSYRRQLWNHTPLTDFWRVGKGIAKKLESRYVYTMGDIARLSVENDEVLYQLFGVNAELLIDHAWGYEPCTIQQIKSYKPEGHSISQGQVLSCPYTAEKGRLIVQEMADLLSLELVRKAVVCDQIVLTVGYDNEGVPKDFKGKFEVDRYGRKIPKGAHGSINLEMQTASTKLITQATLELYDRIVNEKLCVRRMYVVANHVIPESDVVECEKAVQYSLFDDIEQLEKEREEKEIRLAKEKNLQKTLLNIKEKYGKNAILKGMNFQEGATTIERNGQVGGHKA